MSPQDKNTLCIQCENVYVEVEKKKYSVIYCCTHESHLLQDSVVYRCLFSCVQKIPSRERATR